VYSDPMTFCFPKHVSAIFMPAGISRGTRRPTDMTYSRAAPSARASAGAFGRQWSPMLELVADRNLQTGSTTNWISSPQFQVPLIPPAHPGRPRLPVASTTRRAGPTRLCFISCGNWFRRGLFEGGNEAFHSPSQCLRALLSAQLVAASMLVADEPQRREPAPRPASMTSDRCIACHNVMITPRERNSRFGLDCAPASWPLARDPYWQRACCSRSSPSSAESDRRWLCRRHMPMARPRQTFVATPGRSSRICRSIRRRPEDAEAATAFPARCAPYHGGEIWGRPKASAAGFVSGQPDASGRPFGVRPFDIDRAHTHHVNPPPAVLGRRMRSTSASRGCARASTRCSPPPSGRRASPSAPPRAGGLTGVAPHEYRDNQSFIPANPQSKEDAPPDRARAGRESAGFAGTSSWLRISSCSGSRSAITTSSTSAPRLASWTAGGGPHPAVPQTRAARVSIDAPQMRSGRSRG